MVPLIEAELSEALQAGRRLAQAPPGEEVVISGISGVFPDSDSVTHLQENLFSKRDLITDDSRRWDVVNPEVPRRSGKLNCITKFDTSFFGLHAKEARMMDPQARILHEHTYSAILDAGLNPQELHGSKTGLFLGSCFSEAEIYYFTKTNTNSVKSYVNYLKAGLATRLAHWLKINGPSYIVDTACSSSSYAMDHAYASIRDGTCDQAIVGSCNLCLKPDVTLQFNRLGVLSPDGACKSFDDSGNGYVRSESACVILLQKLKDAKRVYATIVHSKTNCDGYTEKGITYPSGLIQEKLLREIYQECQIDPTTVAYVEAHGTGTVAGDPEECSAIDAVFCKGRSTPLPIGSVKSNLGHTESSCALNSIAKIIIAMETGIIPPNLHYKTPNKNIPALLSGRLQVVTELQPWSGGLIGVNSFGFGGANAHMLLRSNAKTKVNGGAPSDRIPRLVTVSGRTLPGVQQLLDDLESRPVDAELVRLYHGIHALDTPGHVFRGYTIFAPGKTTRDIKYFDRTSRPVWLIFSGMDGDWAAGGVGKSLLSLPVFAEAMEKCHQVLKPKGVNIRAIITADKMDDGMHACLATTAIQIGLVDVLKTVGIHSDGLIGYSIGEIAAGYADNCLSIEQAILAAFYYGISLFRGKPIAGSMSKIIGPCSSLPPDMDVAGYDSCDSFVVSGPAASEASYVARLAQQRVKTKAIHSHKTALHSRYVASAGPKLKEYLDKIIPIPEVRSKRWVSTSVPASARSTDFAKFASPDYFANNLLSPVLFRDAVDRVPRNAVLIEVSPSTVLQHVLQGVEKNTISISLTDSEVDSIEYFLSSLGRLYEAGIQLQLANLYPEISFPVSRGTPMIAPLIAWNHTQDHFSCLYNEIKDARTYETHCTINCTDVISMFYTGHVIDGRNLFPATGYFNLVWDVVYALRVNELGEKARSVVFENTRFHRATHLPIKGDVTFHVALQKHSGNFEMTDGGTKVVTGRIYIPDDIKNEMIYLEPPQDIADKIDIQMSKRDVYKELGLRGYNYSGLFRSITSASCNGKRGKIQWLENWEAFMDNMLQMKLLSLDSRGLYVPTSIDKLTIDFQKHMEMVNALPADSQELDVYVCKESGLISAGGIEIRGLNASPINRRKPLGEPVIETYQFIPNTNKTPLSEKLELKLSEIVRVCIHVGLENQSGIRVKAVELVDAETDPDNGLLAPLLAAVLGDLPLIQADVAVLAAPDHILTNDLASSIRVEHKPLSEEEDCLFVVGTNLMGRAEVLAEALQCVKERGFIITRETTGQPTSQDETLQVLNEYSLENSTILLLKKASAATTATTTTVVHIEGADFAWIPVLKEALKTAPSTRVVMVAQGEPTSGIVGLFNCIRMEPGGDDARCVFIVDPTAPVFDLQLPLYKEQLSKDVAMNVYKRGCWGSFRHLPLKENALVDAKHAFANSAVMGDVSSLCWLEGPIDPDRVVENPQEELVHIYYSALNFRDVLLATGKLSTEIVETKGKLPDCVQGLEFSGRTSNGTRVMGMVATGAMSTVKMADRELLWEIPDHWSMEDAATVPVVYGTVFQALMMTGGMKRGDSVLIHSGSGGVGQAAINVALHTGCTVYTTVGTQEKRDFIKNTFPQLTDRHIGNSRDTSFEQLVMTETSGRGVDLVLNSLAEEKLLASVRCLAVGGRFLEIGKYDLVNNNPLGMDIFLKETSFHGVMLDKMFSGPGRNKKPLSDMLVNGIRNGAVKPLKRTVFAGDDVEKAFRYMGAGKHIGKVLLQIRPEESDLKVVPKTLLRKAVPRFSCDANNAYVITGGLGGFGLELADWLVLRGARNLVLTSRTGIKTGYQRSRVDIWRAFGAVVHVSTAALETEQGVTTLLEEANRLGPVAAIFNLAVVLADALFENQTAESFRVSADTKSEATQHLDKMSRKLCPRLKHFVVFSSLSCGRGNAGQTNYGMANSVMERICEGRVEAGYPGLAVQWGAVGDVGVVADMMVEHKALVNGGTLPQGIASCLQVLDRLLMQPHPVVASMVVAEKRVGAGGASSVLEFVANCLGLLDWKKVSALSTLAELGMDSMVAAEIKQSLERDFQIFLTPREIRTLTLAKLAELENKVKDDSKGDSSNRNADDDVFSFLFNKLSDEDTASKPTYILPSLINKADTDDIVPNYPTMFVIPGVEGSCTVLESLAKNLKFNVIGLQLNYWRNSEATTTLQMAQLLLPEVTSRLSTNTPFYLLGHSFGAVLAMQLCLLLETEGHHGKLFTIDGAPALLQQMIQLVSRDGSEDTLQIGILIYLIHQINPQNTDKTVMIRDDLSKLANWDERVEFTVSLLVDSKYSIEFGKSLVNTFLARVKSFIHFTWLEADKLKAKVMLLRPKYDLSHLDSDYGLSKYCETPVDVHRFEGDHVTILESTELANILNNQFDVDSIN